VTTLSKTKQKRSEKKRKNLESFFTLGAKREIGSKQEAEAKNLTFFV
jgi:hypothetical protein